MVMRLKCGMKLSHADCVGVSVGFSNAAFSLVFCDEGAVMNMPDQTQHGILLVLQTQLQALK